MKVKIIKHNYKDNNNDYHSNNHFLSERLNKLQILPFFQPFCQQKRNFLTFSYHKQHSTHFQSLLSKYNKNSPQKQQIKQNISNISQNLTIKHEKKYSTINENKINSFKRNFEISNKEKEIFQLLIRFVDYYQNNNNKIKISIRVVGGWVRDKVLFFPFIYFNFFFYLIYFLFISLLFLLLFLLFYFLLFFLKLLFIK